MDAPTYRTCLVGLDYTDTDRHVLAQTEELLHQLSVKRILLAHVDPAEEESPVDSPAETAAIPEGLPANQTEAVRLRGHAETELSRYIAEGAIDLLCVGLKHSDSRFARVGRRILCMTQADVLFVPAVPPRRFDRILVPTDLSRKSFELVEKTQQLFPQAKLEVFFANYIPPETVMERTAREELIRTSSENLEASMKEFLQGLECPSCDISYGYTMTGHFNAGIAIHEYALKEGFDLIVVGRLSSLDKELPFLGSVTEKILLLSNQIPVLVINH